MNLWLLTEERPKRTVVKQIITKFAEDRNLKAEFNELEIKPIIENKRFTW